MKPITADELWDALRKQCCASGLDAKTIVQVRKPDVAAALKSLQTERVSGAVLSSSSDE